MDIILNPEDGIELPQEKYIRVRMFLANGWTIENDLLESVVVELKNQVLTGEYGYFRKIINGNPVVEYTKALQVDEI